jgi:hypothetical protein
VATESWLNFFFPPIRFPASGNLEFLYNPYTKWEAPCTVRGDERVEQRVYTEVASAGRQLGKITEVVLQLVAQMGFDSPEVKGLQGVANDVEAIKRDVEDRTEKDARAMLDRLGEKDRERLRSLLAEYSAKE